MARARAVREVAVVKAAGSDTAAAVATAVATWRRTVAVTVAMVSVRREGDAARRRMAVEG
jgi:hypothetical protein